jgi:hypothetical protein
MIKMVERAPGAEAKQASSRRHPKNRIKINAEIDVIAITATIMMDRLSGMVAKRATVSGVTLNPIDRPDKIIAKSRKAGSIKAERPVKDSQAYIAKEPHSQPAGIFNVAARAPDAVHRAKTDNCCAAIFWTVGEILACSVMPIPGLNYSFRGLMPAMMDIISGATKKNLCAYL